MLQVYDQLGIISLLLMFIFGGRLVNLFVGPALQLVNWVLVSV